MMARLAKAAALVGTLLVAQDMAEAQIEDIPSVFSPLETGFLYDDADADPDFAFQAYGVPYSNVLSNSEHILLDGTWLDQLDGATLRSDRSIFDLPSNLEVEAGEPWFYRTQIASPTMFSGAHPAASYWLGVRDRGESYLDGRQAYPLTLPLPVPAKLFWALTVYDPYTRNELHQSKAVGSMFELRGASPANGERQWIDTVPGTGWFLYFSLQGLEGSRRPADRTQ